MFAPLAAVAGALLAAFHLWLLGQQAWSGRLEYSGSLRWLLAFGLVAGLAALHRRGLSLWGRRSTALWVLAAVLHGPAFADNRGTPPQTLAETSDVAMQLAGAVLGLGLAVTLGHAARAWQPAVDFGIAPAWLFRFMDPRQASFGDGFLPRPPPTA